MVSTKYLALVVHWYWVTRVHFEILNFRQLDTLVTFWSLGFKWRDSTGTSPLYRICDYRLHYIFYHGSLLFFQKIFVSCDFCSIRLLFYNTFFPRNSCPLGQMFCGTISTSPVYAMRRCDVRVAYSRILWSHRDYTHIVYILPINQKTICEWRLQSAIKDNLVGKCHYNSCKSLTTFRNEFTQLPSSKSIHE